MILNRCLQLTQYEKWPVKNSIAFIHQNALFRKTTRRSILKLKIITTIMKCISVSTPTLRFFSSSVNKPIQNYNIVYKFVPRFCHFCYTRAPCVMFSVIV